MFVDGSWLELEKLDGQHQLFGWHIGSEIMDFLATTHAELDVDEYDFADSDLSVSKMTAK